ncbi:MAG: hypothetical protein MUO99_04230 [Dehalococcoidales bacterium]|nr:hypothetical protein [Dehalococcoidales bacterium]
MQGGYVGRLLEVDLTSKKWHTKELPPEETLKKFMGCFGLGLRLLYDELPTGVPPDDAANPLFFFTGPLTGTSVPCPTNTTLVTKNFDTGFTIGRSHTHGYFGVNLKFCGYDGLLIRGKSKTPVYLWIHDDEVEICDAGSIWGKDTHETEDLVKQAVGEPKASVAAIGPAGENLCAGALIANDRNHSFSHSGGGSVMGSKKLKAIAVHGSRKVPIANEEAHKKAAKDWLDTLKGFPSSVYNGLGKGGLPRGDYARIKEYLGVSAYNWQTTQLSEFGVGMSKQKITPRTCYGCPIACAYDMEIVSGPYKGYVATPCGGGEALEGSSSILGISEVGAVYYLTDLYDRLGIEGSTAGCAISLAFEAYQRGLITKKDTDGLELKWGDPAVAEQMVKRYAYREGFGDILARGPKEAAEYIGHDAPGYAVHIKGSGMSLHDWRSTWGILLGQIVGSGAGWPSGCVDVLHVEPSIGYPEFTDRLGRKGKPVEVAKCTILKSLHDCTGTCWFAAFGVPRILELVANAVSTATGFSYSKDDVWEVGERVLNLERAFNIKHGLTPEDDYNVSDRIVDAPPDGPAKGISIKPYLKGMVNEYYRFLGWDTKSGKPMRPTLHRLGLDDIAEDLW